MKKIKKAIKEIAGTTKLLTYNLPKEIAKRAISPSYTHKQVFGEPMPKKKKKK